MHSRTLFAAGALLCALAVAAGAFGAHALKAFLNTDQLAIYDTAVRYLIFHGLGLFAAAWAADRCTSRLATLSGGLFIVGTLLFSGSLFLIAITGWRGLGFLTPIGGLAFITGWLCLAGTTRTWILPPDKPL